MDKKVIRQIANRLALEWGRETTELRRVFGRDLCLPAVEIPFAGVRPTYPATTIVRAHATRTSSKAF
jgi:hypothetical protein